MSLQERLVAEMKEAMRAGNQAKLSVIRLLRASIKNREIEKGKGNPLTEQELLEVVVSSIKQRRDSIEQFAKGGRQDLVEKEEKEAEILKAFLPQPLTREELIEKAKAVIRETGAQGPKDMGKVMKVLMPQVVGRVEGATVSQVVKDLLTQA
jgi:uncharacterized protein YqeY